MEDKNLEKQLEEANKQCEEYLNGWKRAKADFINYQKDERKRLEEAIKFGNWDLIQDLVTVLDSFDLAVAALEKNSKVDKGVYMIRSQLEDALRKRGLERIIVSVGQPFDPNLQEAIGEAESDKPPGTIAEEVEWGYLLNGRVIRPARVKIVKSH